MIMFFNSLLFLISIFLIFSCGLDEEKKPAEMPSEWSGGEDEFQNKFTTREDGNETLVLYRETDLPFEGQVERNGTNTNTVQSFKSGKLNGLSIKKSKDGSWVEANYKDGKLHGEMIFYGRNGKKRSVLTYENGQLKK